MFYCADLPAAGERVTLDAEESRHAAGARRLATGDRLTLFDGRGRLAQATLLSATRRGAEVRIAQVQTVPPPLPLHLACALPKGDRQAVLFDMATQLGMTGFTPLVCARSVVKPGPSAAARWSRICVEACKQSRRAYVPQLHAAAAPGAVAATAAADGQAVWIAEPAHAPASVVVARGVGAPGLTLLIGPEGGFTAEEVATVVANGGVAVDLGPAILRIETAAAALLSYATLAHRGGDAAPAVGE